MRRSGARYSAAGPGPLVHLIPPGVVDRVLGRADWWAGNAREAARLTGCQGPAAAASALAQRAGVLVRTGPDGCLLCCRGGVPVHVPGFRVDAVDTNGAGDAHTGTFIAARTANAAGPGGQPGAVS